MGPRAMLDLKARLAAMGGTAGTSMATPLAMSRAKTATAMAPALHQIAKAKTVPMAWRAQARWLRFPRRPPVPTAQRAEPSCRWDWTPTTMAHSIRAKSRRHDTCATAWRTTEPAATLAPVAQVRPEAHQQPVAQVRREVHQPPAALRQWVARVRSRLPLVDIPALCSRMGP